MSEEEGGNIFEKKLEEFANDKNKYISSINEIIEVYIQQQKTESSLRGFKNKEYQAIQFYFKMREKFENSLCEVENYINSIKTLEYDKTQLEQQLLKYEDGIKKLAQEMRTNYAPIIKIGYEKELKFDYKSDVEFFLKELHFQPNPKPQVTIRKLKKDKDVEPPTVDNKRKIHPSNGYVKKENPEKKIKKNEDISWVFEKY
jgi:hypothetical protein